jgi:hypothetical protein
MINASPLREALYYHMTGVRNNASKTKPNNPDQVLRMTLHRWSKSTSDEERGAVMLLAETCNIGKHGSLGKILGRGHVILDTMAPLFSSPCFYRHSKLKPNTLLSLIEGGWDLLVIFITRGSGILDFIASSTPLPGADQGPVSTWDLRGIVEKVPKAAISVRIRDRLISAAERAYLKAWGPHMAFYGHDCEKAHQAQKVYIAELLQEVSNTITAEDALNKELEFEVRKGVVPKIKALLCNPALESGGSMLAYGPGMLPDLPGGVPLLCPGFVTWLAEMLDESAFCINLVGHHVPFIGLYTVHAY